MLSTIFNGIFQSATISVVDFVLCIGVSLLVGVLLALGFMFKSRYTKSFVFTLALLPAVVCVVIMMVNGNVGTGVAVAGAFSLVRFRSAPGTAKEISMLFVAMGAGLITGMGYLGYAVLFTLIMITVSMLYSALDFGAGKSCDLYKTVRITIPEDLDYTGVFEDIFERYTTSHKPVKVKTTNMGSMFRISYDITLKDPTLEKQMIDELRCRNGNLEISVSLQESNQGEL